MSPLRTITENALLGMHWGQVGISHSASQIANGVERAQPSSRSTDFARSLVTMQQHATQVKGSAKALQAAGDALGTLLDIRV